MTELLPRKAKRRIWSLRRRDGPKSRKLHLGEYVAKSARLPSEPPYKKPVSKGRLRSPLVCLSPPSFFKQRKIGSPKGVRFAARPVKT